MRRSTSSVVRVLVVATAFLVALDGCSSAISQRSNQAALSVLPSSPTPGPNEALALAPSRAERVLSEADLDIRAHKGAGGGVTGASKLTLYAPAEDLQLEVKWKPVPSDLDGWNNSPRKELAAYELQKLFLDPDDYVVPPTVIRCLPLTDYAAAFPQAPANVAGADCVLGVMSLWLHHARPEKDLLDPDRFGRDANYAYHLSNFNVLTFLIGHKDGRSSNFLVASNESDRRVFAIDNGIAFDPWIYNFLVSNWDELRVGAVSRKAIERLRQASEEDLRKLGVVADLRLGDDGALQRVETGTNLAPARGVRTEPGIVQLGLTEKEIDAVRSRLARLLDAVSNGELRLF